MSAPVFDLAERRAERVAARAARREGRGETTTLRFGACDVLLGAEFPLDVLAPFAEVNVDLPLLIRKAIDATSATDSAAQADTFDTIVSILASNPDLPREVIEAVKECGRRLLGEDGYAALVAERPTPWDVGDLVKYLLGWFGVSLGESSSASTPSADGATSKPTSSATTDLTLELPGDGRTPPGSSGFAGSRF